MNRPFKAIAAMSENRVIGDNGTIPWRIPEDFKWVKQCTQNQVIAMGRKTFESMGRPLPNRTNIVLSRSPFEHPQTEHLSSIEALLTYPTDKEIWIFGGAEIYKQAFPYIDDLYLTVVKRTVNGDAFFPPFEDEFTHLGILRETDAFTIHHYKHT